MNKIIAVLPYCQSDHAAATRLLDWIKELDKKVEQHLLLVADDAVPMETKKSLNELGKQVFESAETIMVKAPAPVGGNYHPAAAVMFERAMGHISNVYKWNWFWMEPDCVPLKAGWLDALAYEYDEYCPKRFMGSLYQPKQQGLPETIMYGTAVYPNGAYSELKQFCDGKQAFDMAFSPYVVPRAANTNLIFHAFGAPGDAPTFKDAKMPGDGPNVGTIDIIPKEAVVFHRNKDGTLIELLRKSRVNVAQPGIRDMTVVKKSFENWSEPPKRKPGRPPKLPPKPEPELNPA